MDIQILLAQGYQKYLNLSIFHIKLDCVLVSKFQGFLSSRDATQKLSGEI